ncbi:hypothetical protein [Streptomyces pseudogriseolus]|uniref:hypothetical protein n=1 Tax=Streptomyces pseudogriseolus TaxID=36817 RepID=UPI003FA29E07
MTTTPVRPTTAEQAAAPLGALLRAPWMPPIRHCEIADTDGTWGIHLELAADSASDAVHRLQKLASEVAADFTDSGDRVLAVDFTAGYGVPVRVWYLKPITRWIVPTHCATCPALLANTLHVRLVPDGATSDEDAAAPVICVACRDRMYAAWPAQAAHGGTSR